MSFRPFHVYTVTLTGTDAFLHQLLETVAISILIAIIVKEMIERDYEERQFRAMVAAANISRQGVLRVLFSTFFDEDTVAEVNRSIFSSTLVREHATVSYAFSRHPSSEWLVRMQVTLEYEITNVATTPAPFPIGCNIANYAAIFRDDDGLAPPTLLSARIGSRTLCEAEIAAVNAKVDRGASPVTLDLGREELAPNQTLQLCLSYERDKLACDSEVMTMSYPTKLVTVKVENKCAPDLEMGMRAIGQRGFSPLPRGNIDPGWECSSEGIMLQNNGWVLYWNDPALKPSRIPGSRLPPAKAAQSTGQEA